jgi:hypothetical protein
MRRVLLVVSMLASLWPAAVIANAAIGGSIKSSNSSANAAISRSRNSSNSPADATPASSGDGATERSAVKVDPRGNPLNGERRQPDYAGLKALNDRESRLLRRLHNSRSLNGIPDQGVAQTASQLAADYGTWEAGNAGLDDGADNVETRAAAIANRVAAFSRHPSQSRLDAFNMAVSAYNKAVSAYNANLHAGSSYACTVGVCRSPMTS